MIPDVVVKVMAQRESWWDLVPAVLGGIIGALAGGLPAFALARRASRENSNREAKLKDEQDLAKAFRLFAVLRSIVDSLVSTRMQIDEMLEKPAEPGDPTPYQRRIKGLVGFAEEQTLDFQSDDLALLVAAQANDYLVDLTLISRRHASLMSALASYAQYRDRFTQFMLEVGEHEIQPTGEIGTSVPVELGPQIMVREYQLESIIRAAVEMMEEDTPKVIDAAEKFGPTMKAYFGDKGPLLAFEVSELRKRYPNKEAGAD